jgi:hypothetical protein
MKERKKRIYWLVAINCDCGSGHTAKIKGTMWRFGPRCPFCEKILGPIEYRIIGETSARGDIHALDNMHEGNWKKYKLPISYNEYE